MGRQSRDVYEDFEPQAWQQVSTYRDHSQARAYSRTPSRARDRADRHSRGDDWNYDRGWHDRRRGSRSRQVYDGYQSWRSDWKDDRDWHQSDSRSRPSRWRQDSRPRHARPGRPGRPARDSQDTWRKRGDPYDRDGVLRIPERSRSRSVEAGGYGYGYGQSRKGLDPGREEIPPAKAPKAKPGSKKVARKRVRPVGAEGGQQSKTFHDPYQLIDPNEQVDHKVILPDERKEPEEEPPQERLGPKRRGRAGSRDMVGRSPSRSCSLYSYYSYGSYSFSSGWSTPSPRMRQNSRSPSPGTPWHRPGRDVAPGPPPVGPPPGSWSQPQAEAPPPAGSPGPPQYSLHPGPPQLQSAAAWDYRGHPSHYPPPPGHMQPPGHFYGGAFPPARVHYQSPGYPGGPPPPGYGPAPMNQDIGYGRLEAARRPIHRQGGRKGMRKEPKDSAEERDHSDTPKRAKKRRRKNRRPKSPGEPPPKWGDTWEEPRSSNGLKLIHELAPKGLKWKVVLSDESRRSYASFMPSPVPSARLGDFFKTIYGKTAWEQPEGPQGLLPRKTVWMVKSGCQCPYRYGGVTIKPQEFPDWMTELLRTYMPYCGKSEEEWPDSCNVNLYEDGSHAVGWHTDDEALFQSLHQDVAIVSLSLGQPRKFDLRKNWPEEGERLQERLQLGNGALATMEGMLQKHYMHRIARDDESLGPRINLTWRWIKKHADVCPKSKGWP